MKRVTFKIAKAIKEIGYPQTIEGEFASYYDVTGRFYEYSYKVLINPDLIYDAPTYLEVWLWLWKEKKINVTPEYDQISGMFLSCGISEREDPEEAIKVAIEYLVDNDLIK